MKKYFKKILGLFGYIPSIAMFILGINEESVTLTLLGLSIIVMTFELKKIRKTISDSFWY